MGHASRRDSRSFINTQRKIFFDWKKFFLIFGILFRLVGEVFFDWKKVFLMGVPWAFLFFGTGRHVTSKYKPHSIAIH